MAGGRRRDGRRESLVLNGATSQYERWLRPGEPGDAPVDDRSLAELLAFAPRFGELVRFYDLADRIDGDWRDFYLADPLMVVAAMAADAPADDEARYRELLRQARRQRDPETRRELLARGFRLVEARARRMDGWLRGLLNGAERRGARGLHRQLQGLVEGEVGDAVRRVAAWERGAGLPEALGDDPGHGPGTTWDGFQPLWKLDRVSPDASPYGAGPPAARAERVLERLGRPLEVLLDASLLLRPDARQGLESMGDDLAAGDMRPQLALYVAFARLFGTAQDTVNTVSARLRRFYYRDVLREPDRGPRPDRVFLAFTLAQEEGLASTAVPAGTLYPAGEDEAGEEILFESGRSFRVSATTVAELRMLRRLDGPLLLEAGGDGDGTGEPGPARDRSAGPERPWPCDEEGPPAPSAPPAVPRQVLSTAVPAAANQAEAPSDATGWPTFGAALAGEEDGAVTAMATLGFAVASPHLLLTGGDRTLTLTLSIARDEILHDRLEAVAGATGLSPGEVLAGTLEARLALYLSTPGGWFPVEGATVGIGTGSGTGEASSVYVLALYLPPTVPPVVPLGLDVEAAPGQVLGEGEGTDDPVVNATNPSPDLPTVKAYLVQEALTLAGDAGSATFYPYSLLERVRLETVEICTAVEGLADLQVRNTDGEVDPAAPFAVFGGAPQVGSYLELSSPELFVKVPEELRVTLRWLGLPPNDDGFRGWYRDYTVGLDGKPPADGGPLFDNAVFEGGFQVVDPGRWKLRSGDEGGDGGGDGRGDGGMPPITRGCPLGGTAGSDGGTGNDGRGDGGEGDDGRGGGSGGDGGGPPAREPWSVDDGDGDDRRVWLFRAGEDCTATPPPPAARLCSRTVFRFTIVDGLKPLPSPPPYYQPSDSALRLELAAPRYAFGDDLYSINVLDSVVRDLPSGTDCTDLCLTLCQPLSDAGARLEACIAVCSDPAEGAAAICDGCLEALVDDLVLSAVEAFLDCLRRLSPRLDPTLPQVLEDRVQGCASLRREERLRCLRQCRDEARELLAVQDAWSCFEVFDALVVALLCIELARDRCRDVEGTVQQECLVEALAGCRKGLATAYEACLTGCADDCMQAPLDLRYPNSPYLPQAESVTVSYRARCRISPGAEADPCGQVYQLTPFGGSWSVAAAAPPLLPPVPDRGSLLLGLAPHLRAQTLDLLFRMASEDSVPVPGDDPVTWSWLAAGGWSELPEGSLSADGTRGLRGTGIVTLDLPAAPPPGSAAADLLPADRFWLRASVEDDPGRFPRTVSVLPNALVATRRPSTVPPAATAPAAASGTPGPAVFEPLPAGTITSAVQDLPDVASVVQPLPSFGGRPAQVGAAYDLRLAERLRHKDRAIQPWDYERLVLERFPEVWKVAAVPARDAAGCPAPGHVLLMVVAGELGNESSDPTIPRLRSELLERIRDYLARRSSPFVTLAVVNPVYVRVHVCADVVFRSVAATEEDDEPVPAAPEERLERDLVAWLSPWFYDAARAARQGRYAGKADVAEFIRSRSYVQALASLDLKHHPHPEALPWYFLTSAREHHVQAVARGTGDDCGTAPTSRHPRRTP